MRSLALALVLVALGAHVEAATYYVAQTGGNDSRSCAVAQTLATPRLSITQGMACLTTAGDTLYVRTGTYVENLINLPTVGTNPARIRIAAYNSEVVTLAPSGGHWAIYWTNEKYIDWDGINIDSRSVDDAGVKFEFGNGANFNRMLNFTMIHRGGIGNTNAAITVEGTDNQILNCDISGTGGPYAIYLSGDRNIVDGCDIHATSLAGIQIYHYGGNPQGNIVRNTKIHNLTASGFFGLADTRIYGVIISGTNSEVYNVTVYGISFPFSDDTNSCFYVYNASGAKVNNNTCVGNSTQGLYINAVSTTTVARNNLFWNNTQTAVVDLNSGSTTKSNNLSITDPMFSNAGLGDYRLSLGSYAIDTGSATGAPSTDANGVSRPQGGGYDVGAYEFTGGMAIDPSPSGTRVRLGDAPATDAGGNLWSVIVNVDCPVGHNEFRRNSQAPIVTFAACGTQILWYLSVIYVQGDDDQWYQWTGTTFVLVGPDDPNPSQPIGVSVGLYSGRQRWWLMR